MAEVEDEMEALAEEPAKRRRWLRVLGVFAGMILIALAVAWLGRERIVDRVVTGQLTKYDLPATYEIESISPRRQILRNMVIGDPARPDATIERLEVELAPRWNLLAPAISLKVVSPRLYGTYRGGKLSFGTLDKVFFAPSAEPFRLPDWKLELVDGRARLDTEFGQVGVKTEGQGALRDGYSGIVAIAAPALSGAGCTIEKMSLFGKLSVTAEQPRLDGPARFDSLACPQHKLAIGQSAVGIDAIVDRDLKGGEADLQLTGGVTGWNGQRMASSAGSLRTTLRGKVINAVWDLTGKGLVTGQAKAASLAIEGRLRGDSRFTRFESEGSYSGKGVTTGPQADRMLAELERSSADTPVGPLLKRLRRELARETRSSTLSGSYILRNGGTGAGLVLPDARLLGSSGQSLIALSRVQLAFPAGTVPSASGHFATGGPGMPKLSGTFDRDGAGGTRARMTLSEYTADGARLALPDLRLQQDRNGALRFVGLVRMSGPVPGGSVSDLQLPLSGGWTARGGLKALPGCTTLRFGSVALGTLRVDNRAVTACAERGGYLLSGGRLAGMTPGLDLAGAIGTTPLRVRTGPVRLALPGKLSASDIKVETGPIGEPNRFHFATLTATTTGVLSGHVGGLEGGLARVPLDLYDGEADWSFANRLLRVGNASFQVKDREADARFQPLVARDAVMQVEGNMLTADAVLREPETGQEVVRVAIGHDLGPGSGHADLFVDGIAFDKNLQPDTLSRRALGVIANANGTVTGRGRIDWNSAGVTSTGKFSTDGLDFAAAFGPVKGTSGTVEFSDLLGLVTAPDQKLRIASINPGIAVDDGEVVFEMHPDSVLLVKGAKWPFLDGSLELLPVRMVLGAAEVRRYELLVEGANAAKFVQQLELANISASGTFDGRIPLVFDENGGDIVDGYLQSRPPGGNLSYVGELTYRDLSAMGNFAFSTLRSLDYRSMRVQMSGALEGEIVTRVTFDGITQGAGAKRNFITRQIAKLPIRFNVNIRAPFFQLMHSFRSMYDPEALADPRVLGLIGTDGKPIARPATQTAPKQDVQPPASGNVP